LVSASTTLLDPAAGLGAGLFGTLTKVADQVVDGGQGQVGGASAASNGARRSSMFGFSAIVFPFIN